MMVQSKCHNKVEVSSGAFGLVVWCWSSRLVLGDELWHALLSSTTHVCIHLSAVKGEKLLYRQFYIHTALSPDTCHV